MLEIIFIYKHRKTPYRMRKISMLVGSKFGVY